MKMIIDYQIIVLETHLHLPRIGCQLKRHDFEERVDAIGEKEKNAITVQRIVHCKSNVEVIPQPNLQTQRPLSIINEIDV